MSHLTRPALLVACSAALLSAAPANATPPSSDAGTDAVVVDGSKDVVLTGRDKGIATALANLSRTPQADPDVFSDQAAAVLKTRHETAKNSVGNIR